MDIDDLKQLSLDKEIKEIAKHKKLLNNEVADLKRDRKTLNTDIIKARKQLKRLKTKQEEINKEMLADIEKAKQEKESIEKANQDYVKGLRER